MPNRRNNPNNQFVKKSADDQPWNRSRMIVEPAEATPATEPQGRYNDRIKISPVDEGGAATPRAIKNWPEGLKRT
jgi:hypothetical protein